VHQLPINQTHKAKNCGLIEDHDPELYGMHSRFSGVRFRRLEWTDDGPYWYIEAEKRLPRDRSR
jgi:hypothetical protein